MKATFTTEELFRGATNVDGSAWQGGVTPYRKDVPAGSCKWSRDAFDKAVIGLRFTCPCGCGAVSFLPVAPGYGPPVWQWDGSLEEPTLQPSVQMLTPCKWHGYLTKGEWKSV